LPVPISIAACELPFSIIDSLDLIKKSLIHPGNKKGGLTRSDRLSTEALIEL